MNRRTVAVPAVALALFAAACGNSPSPSAAGGGPLAQNSAPVRLNSATAADVLTAITQAKLPAPNPRDVTARDCPTIGCVDKTETDTVSVMVFPNTGRAELYAGSTHGVLLVENVVLSFASSVPASQHVDYEHAAQRAIQ